MVAGFWGAMRKTLYIVRGLPGSGKSTLARMLAPGAHAAADDFFTDAATGEYRFDAARLPDAHANCVRRVENLMLHNEDMVAVHNTFSRKWEAEPYFRLAKNYGYTVFVIECQNSFGSVHNVPDQAIAAMAARWERFS